MKREKSINIEPLLIETMKIADIVVFVSEWMEKYFINKYKLKLNSTHIINGCDESIFYPPNKKSFDKNKKIKIVTHHFHLIILKDFIFIIFDKLLDNQSNF